MVDVAVVVEAVDVAAVDAVVYSDVLKIKITFVLQKVGVKRGKAGFVDV